MSTARPDILAVYYPHWHVYDHGVAWKGEGWTEWRGMAAAKPRFPGHHQPLRSVWGEFDESDPAWVAKEIDLAADHGVDVFLYDWYWYSGVMTMQEALEEGFLQAPNRDRLRFCLMWANHDRRDQFCPEHGAPRTNWMSARHSVRDFDRLIGYGLDHYFHEPNYYRVDGRLYFSIYRPTHVIAELGGPAATRKLFAQIDARLAADGLPPMYWQGMSKQPAEVALMYEAGFSAVGSYNQQTGGAIRDDGTEDYLDVIAGHRELWQKMQGLALPYEPVATMGWDPTPRCRADMPWPFPRPYEYPYTWVVTGNTPDRWRDLLREAAALSPRALLLYAWNEWTEGGYLLPEERTGTAYLEAVREVFGVR